MYGIKLFKYIAITVTVVNNRRQLNVNNIALQAYSVSALFFSVANTVLHTSPGQQNYAKWMAVIAECFLLSQHSSVKFC